VLDWGLPFFLIKGKTLSHGVQGESMHPMIDPNFTFKLVEGAFNLLVELF
jgi:hypothetical protein